MLGGSAMPSAWNTRPTSPVTGVRAWQVLYLSATVTGAPTAVSGTVLVPGAAYPGTRPVVAYAAGTQGWGDQCAPSKEMAAGNFDEQFAVSNLLSALRNTSARNEQNTCPRMASSVW